MCLSKNVSPAPCLFKTRCHINPVGSLHGKLTVTAKCAPGCPATPWQARPAHPSFAPSRPRPPRGAGTAPSPLPLLRNPKSETRTRFPPIKAKTPAIKANQASSRQIPFFGQPARWMGRTGSRKVETCAKVLPLRGGEGRGEGERHYQSIPFCSHTQPIKAKTTVIVHHQGISRHPQKSPVPLDAWCLELLWSFPAPFATLLRVFALKTKASSHNQASSRLIKANAKISHGTRHPAPDEPSGG